MIAPFKLICLILAFVLFILAGLNVSHPRINFVGWGLAFWVLSLIIG